MDRFAPIDWTSYLDSFHADHPGITEDVLGQSHSNEGLTPYEWVVAPLPTGLTVLDLACGSGPCLELRRGDPWIGLDRSEGELDRARLSGTVHLVRGDATTLPFQSAAFDGAVCSMALMLAQPLDRVIGEVSRVLRNDANFVFIMPGRRPLRVRDIFRYAHLTRRLGRWKLRYPNDRALRHLSSLLDHYGFDVIDDRRKRFTFSFASIAETQKFVLSLYLPEVTSPQLAKGVALAASWTGTDIAIPLRRVTARRRSR